MPIRTRLSLAILALSSLVALVVASGPGDAAAFPKLPKHVPYFVERQMDVSASGTITYRWTYDSTEKCVPGYAKTVEEEFSFDFPKHRTKMEISHKILVSGALRGGSGKLEVRLGGWRTTNFCDPEKREPEPKQPTCKNNSTPLIVSIEGTATELARDEDDPAPLARETQIAIQRSKPFAQDPKCIEQRPDLHFEPTEAEEELGWYADPKTGIATGLNANTISFGQLKVGKTLKRRIDVGGGCGGATARASAVAEIPFRITSCTLSGVVHVKVTRVK
jgi:hypothetical protein